MTFNLAQLLSAISSAGYPATMIGGVLLLFFYLRKQEGILRQDFNVMLQRLQKDRQDLQTRLDARDDELDEKEAEIDKERRLRRDAEDEATKQRRRADDLADILRKNDEQS